MRARSQDMRVSVSLIDWYINYGMMVHRLLLVDSRGGLGLSAKAKMTTTNLHFYCVTPIQGAGEMHP